MALQIEEDKPTPPIVGIYGREGVGKTTFGAMSKKPIFFSLEGGTKRLLDRQGNPIRRVKGPNGNAHTWETVRAGIRDLINDQHDRETLVMDTADALEGLCHQRILQGTGKTMKTVEGGYAAGYKKSKEMHEELIADLFRLNEQRNMSIIITAHAAPKDQKDPTMPHDYDAYEMKCEKDVSALWAERVEALIFVRYRTFTKDSEDTKKARAFTDGSRVAYTEGDPAFKAKNRFGLPKEMNFDLGFYDEFMKYAEKGVQPETAAQIRVEIAECTNMISDADTVGKIAETVTKAGDDVSELNKIRARLREITAQQSA